MAEIDNYVATLNQNGYVVLDSVISPDRCAQLVGILEDTHDRLAPIYAANATAGHRLNFHADEKIVYNLHNKDRAFLDFIDPSPVYDIVERFLQQGSYKNSDPVILRQNTARTPLPGGPEQQLHIDSRIAGGAFPLMAVVTWMLEDFTEENGATRIVPGSQRRPEFPPDEAADPDEVVVTGTRGSVLIMDAAAWHGGGANRSNATRWCLLSTYVRWFFKPAFDFLSNMPEELYAQMTPRQKQTMGYTTQPPVDEFTRISARSDEPAKPLPYSLPKGNPV
jgi:ectoine hydroxylase-related dioxygenase (phytanoyl-CoA dioxygenase family)